MKVYDKEIYEKQESIKFTVLIIVAFLVGFVAGYLACSYSNVKPAENKNNIVNVQNLN